MKSHQADRLTGILGIVVSASYVAYARNIEDSLLADEVGAAGVPSAVGAVLMLAAANMQIEPASAPVEKPKIQRGVEWPSRSSMVALMRRHGVNAFLVGEAFMRASDPGAALGELFN